MEENEANFRKRERKKKRERGELGSVVGKGSKLKAMESRGKLRGRRNERKKGVWV